MITTNIRITFVHLAMTSISYQCLFIQIIIITHATLPTTQFQSFSVYHPSYQKAFL